MSVEDAARLGLAREAWVVAIGCRAAPRELDGQTHTHDVNQSLAFAEDEGHVATGGCLEPFRTHVPLALSADRARAVCLRVVLNVDVSAAALDVVATNSRVRLRLIIWYAREIELFVGHWHALRRVRAIGSHVHALFNRAEREGRSEEEEHFVVG